MSLIIYWTILGAHLLSDDTSKTNLEKKISQREGQIIVNSLNLHYREWGSSNLPPLLILHGLTGHAWEFDGLAMALAVYLVTMFFTAIF